MLLALALAGYLWVASLDRTPAFDRVLIDGVRASGPSWIGSVMRGVSEVGFIAWLGPLSIAIGAAIAMRTRRFAPLEVLAISTFAASVMTRIGKELAVRERPHWALGQHIDTYSLPSGHAAVGAAFSLGLVLAASSLLPRRWYLVLAAAAATFALLDGISRVWLGVHWPSDVLVGWLLGAGTALVVAAASSWRRSRVPARGAGDRTAT